MVKVLESRRGVLLAPFKIRSSFLTDADFLLYFAGIPQIRGR